MLDVETVAAGGLVRAEAFRGRDAVVSGPAGGVVGVARTATEAGVDAVLGFDMGGTSTDVCRFAGRLERRDAAKVAGVRLRSPMLDVETVAAGGGSILAFDGMRARAGPASAGADPGPACRSAVTCAWPMPHADSTLPYFGHSTSETPNASAIWQATWPAAPPNATSACSRGSKPRSVEMRRTA